MDNDIFSDENKKRVEEYENSIAQGREIYFDPDEFGSIADYYFSQSEYDLTREVIHRALKIHPDDIDLLWYEAKFLQDEERYEDILNLIGDKLYPYDLEVSAIVFHSYLQLGLTQDANRVKDYILKSEPEGSKDVALAEIAYIYASCKMYKDAINYYKLQFEIDNLPQTLNEIGYCYEELDELQTALNYYEHAIDLAPYFEESWAKSAHLYFQLEEYEKSLEKIEFAIFLAKEPNTFNLVLKFTCLFFLNRKQESISVLDDIKALADENPNIYLDLNLAKNYARCDKFEKAFDVLQEYENIFSKDANYYLAKVEIALVMDNHSYALFVAKEGLKEVGDDVDLLMALAEVHTLLGNVNESKDVYHQIFKRIMDEGIEVPNQFYDLYIKVAIKTEDYELARTLTMLEIIDDPENIELTKKLALIHLELNDSTKFNEILEKLNNSDLLSLLSVFFFSIDTIDKMNRTELIVALNNAMENRSLYKNLKY